MSPDVGVVFSVAAPYFALGHRRLHDHAYRVALMVGCGAATLDIAVCTAESVLKSGNDGVFGAPF